ncbi:MAG: aldo/keto reductase [Actinomycetales bacterium]|nr:aldo/keto reductase [Actinomycetales bacterium]
MEQRILGRTQRPVSVVGLGCWQLGADWGDVAEEDALAVLNAALDSGVTFLDTADVYGDGRSERLVGQVLAERGRDGVFVATKMGRRASPHEASEYTADNFRRWNDRSRENLGVDTLDLVQLHCPPSEVLSKDETYDVLDAMVDEGRIAAYGVSVETVEEALTAIARPNVASIQIILNLFRRKPLERVLPAAVEAGVGIIARVPLASGLLTGRYDDATEFAPNDHRNFNRAGEAFDVGETFAGVPYSVGVLAAQRVSVVADRAALSDISTAQFALRWIIDQPGVTTVIPGASRPEQARSNAAAAELPPLSEDASRALAAIYAEDIHAHVHHRW